jgi:hypothetical protein
MALQSRGVRTLFVSTLVLTAALSACDQPTEVEPALDPAFAPAPPPLTTVSCAGTDIGGRKNVQVKVLLSTEANANGAVVTLVSKQDGPQCYGTTKTDGIVLFTDVAQGAEIFVTARDEVTEEVAKLEIIPPEIPNSAAELAKFNDSPSATPSRQVPMLLSGTACTDSTALSWANWSAKNGAPCVVPGPGLNLTIKFSANAHTTNLTLLDPSGAELENVIVAALSPWNFNDPQSRPAACDLARWVANCEDPTLSSGPALIQSLDLTDSDGFVSLAHSHANTLTQPIVLEAITAHNDLTFFGTVTQGSGTVQMAPGMCTIATVVDSMDSSIPDVDIQYTQHSVGMSWGPNATPTAINNALVVRAEVWATTAGGAGRYDLSWQTGGSPARSVRADFNIPSGGANLCTEFSWSGNGLNDVDEQGYCAKSADQTGVPSGRTAYTLYFVLTGVPEPITDAFYTLNTVQDGIDPSKSSNTRAAISFNGAPPPVTDDDTLNRLSCPVPENNDGRFGTFRLGSNDGRFGTF